MKIPKINIYKVTLTDMAAHRQERVSCQLENNISNSSCHYAQKSISYRTNINFVDNGMPMRLNTIILWAMIDLKHFSVLFCFTLCLQRSVSTVSVRPNRVQQCTLLHHKKLRHNVQKRSERPISATIIGSCLLRCGQ